nr:RNA binding (RRM/RBD/RNP motifs) family protein [Tanacetum cinerariifolium]
MSGEGDRSCPLCTEKMNLNDQQLNPRKCGYDVIVTSGKQAGSEANSVTVIELKWAGSTQVNCFKLEG